MGTESADLGVGAEYPVVCGAVEGARAGPAKVEWANPSCTAGQFRLFGLVGTRADRGRSVAQDRATADNERAIPFFIHQGDIP
jgi:hypothetical protein